MDFPGPEDFMLRKTLYYRDFRTSVFCLKIKKSGKMRKSGKKNIGLLRLP
jgi:hypothetical protein